jgi:predicted transcriptional regulator
MQKLMKKGWIKKRDQRKKGKGRPVHIYKLNEPINKILKKFEQEKLNEIEVIKKDLAQLKDIVDSR